MLDKVKALLERLDVSYQALIEIDLKEDRSMATFIVDGQSAEAVWRQLTQIEEQTELTPLILGGAESFEAHLETLGLAYDEPDLSVAEILEESREIDFADLIAARLEDFVYEQGEWPDSDNAFDPAKSPQVLDPGAASAGKEHRGKGVFESEKEIYIGLIDKSKTTAMPSYELPVWLLFGGFGDCPQPYQHPTVLKHWLDAHEARLMAIGSDYLQCDVARPPQNRDEALKLAREHFAYSRCPIEQGPGQLAPYAAQLLGNHTWNFWWE
mgnify:CR=1 FL=1